MRTKDEIIDSYKDESLLKAKTQDIIGLTEAMKLEVLIDIRDILNELLKEDKRREIVLYKRQ